MRHTERPTGTQATSVASDLLASLDALGLEDALPDVREAVARALEVKRMTFKARGDLADIRGDLADQIVDGTIATDDAVAEMVRQRLILDDQGEGQSLLRLAASRAGARVWRLVLDHGDSIVTDVLRPAFQALVAELVEIAGELPDGIEDNESAMSAGADVLVKWARMVEIEEQLRDFWHLADDLRMNSVIANDPDAHPSEVAYRHPERLRSGISRGHAAVRLVAQIEAGAEPDLVLAHEIGQTPEPPARTGTNWAKDPEGTLRPARRATGAA